MRTCANPNCNEPIEGASCRGRHPICHNYLRQIGRERPAPASTILRQRTDSRPTTQETAQRARRATTYRRALEDAQDTRIKAMMPQNKRREKP